MRPLNAAAGAHARAADKAHRTAAVVIAIAEGMLRDLWREFDLAINPPPRPPRPAGAVVDPVAKPRNRWLSFCLTLLRSAVIFACGVGGALGVDAAIDLHNGRSPMKHLQPPPWITKALAHTVVAWSTPALTQPSPPAPAFDPVEPPPLPQARID